MIIQSYIFSVVEIGCKIDPLALGMKLLAMEIITVYQGAALTTFA
jgi:hypothetical protein